MSTPVTPTAPASPSLTMKLLQAKLAELEAAFAQAQAAGPVLPDPTPMHISISPAEVAALADAALATSAHATSGSRQSVLQQIAGARKAILGFLVPAATVLVAAVQDGSPGGGHITSGEWILAAVAALGTSSAVYSTTNGPKPTKP